MQVQPYLWNFDGRCAAALAFYRRVLGANVEMSVKFRDAPPDTPMPEGINPDHTMRAYVKIGDTAFMASDGSCKGNLKFDGFSLCIWVDSPAEADRVFAAMSEGGKIGMPLTETFYSPRFGMVTDAFGVAWMVMTKP